MHHQQVASLDLTQAELLGEGGEAQIYALDETHVVRLFRQGAMAADVASRTVLLAEVAAGAAHLPFETPTVLAQGTAFGRIYTVEKRIPGTSLLTALGRAQGEVRRRLIARYMDTAWQLGDIHITRPYVGEIGRKDAVQTSTWHAYLSERARRSLSASPLAQVDAAAVAASVAVLDTAPAFVHLDYFAGNVMVNDNHRAGVIDFGYASILGDRRMNALVAAAHLVTPRITPTVTAADQAVAFAWLRQRELDSYYEHGLRWLAAYWAFAHDDIGLMAWCRSILT